MPRIEHSICPAYLSEPISGMQCPLVSDPGTNIFLAPLLFAPVLVQFKLCNQLADPEVRRNLATMILAACDLNEHGGKHHVLQTSPQPMSKSF